MQKAEEELDTIIKKFLNSDIDREKIHKLDVIKNFGGNKSAIKNFKINLTLLITLIAFIIGRELILSTNTSVSHYRNIITKHHEFVKCFN